MSNTTATVFVVDDDPAMRRSLRWLLESADLSVEVFESALDFLKVVTPQHAGCVVLDVRMPTMNGLELQQRLLDRGIALPVIVITGFADVSMAVRAMKAGAIDFVEKPFSDELLLDRIMQALSRDAAHREKLTRSSETRDRLATLTQREQQVMELVVAGHSNKEMAELLKVSKKTIEAHRSHVMHKMNAESLAELVRKVLAAKEEPKQ